MKTVVRKTRLMFRLGLTAGVLLFSQQSLAQGTDAGTEVRNQASVEYSVGGNLQPAIESSPTGNSVPGGGADTLFLVDRRVDFTLIEVDGAHTIVSPGDSDAITAFTLQNDGNAIMDFRLEITQLGSTDQAVHGEADTDVDVSNLRIRVANGDGAGGVPDLATDLAFVDELGEGEIVEIYVFADADTSLTNGDFANLTLTAYAADDATATATPAVLDADLAETPGADDPLLIESVFADADNDGLEAADDGYEVQSAALQISKTVSVISDPFGSGKALPGAILEYEITVDNSAGASAATSVSITDDIDADVTFVAGAYGGAGQDISLDNGGAASTCSADAAGSDTDGCSLDGVTMVVGNTNGPITVAAGAVLVVRFQVEIPTL